MKSVYKACKKYINKVLLYLGCDATLTVFVKELKCLWSLGMLVDDIYYRIALVFGIWDGRGFEKVTLTQG